MAGASPQPTPNSSKKHVDFQLNMVPFIDLLSVLISFLLMTSAWTQVAQIEAKQTASSAGSEPESVDDGLKLTVLITREGYVLTAKSAELMRLPKRDEGYDALALGAALGQQHDLNPANRALIVRAEDAVPYQEMVTVMDLAMEHRLSEISVDGVAE
ncbi:MAG: biopolymer transporter ExbD [Myxococcota bacterium]